MPGHDSRYVWTTRGLPPVATWALWRNLAVYFCVFSLAGHWFELIYCFVMDSLFGIVDSASLVWDDFLQPFPVYGFGVVICAVVVVPLKNKLFSHFSSNACAGAVFFVIAVLFGMAMELAQGFLQNVPDENGIYPLWDNSQLPLNILGQAWLVNDIGIGLLITLFVLVILPRCERAIAALPPVAANIGAVVIVAAFICLCAVKSGGI